MALHPGRLDTQVLHGIVSLELPPMQDTRDVARVLGNPETHVRVPQRLVRLDVHRHVKVSDLTLPQRTDLNQIFQKLVAVIPVMVRRTRRRFSENKINIPNLISDTKGEDSTCSRYFG